MSNQLDPYKVICVVKFDGREVGRVAAAAQNAEAYITELSRQYGSVSVEYVEDPDAWIFAALSRR